MTPRIAIVLNNLRAEGGPALAGDLCEEWLKVSIQPILILLDDDAMDMADRFNAQDIPIEILHVRQIGPKNYPRLFSHSYRVFRKLRPDAVVSIPSGVHGVIFAAARAAGIRRNIVHIGNYPWHWDTRNFWKYRLLMRWSKPFTSSAVCVTDHVRQGVEQYFGRVGQETLVINNGINVGTFSLAKKRTTNGIPVILMVGRLDIGKDHLTLLHALALLNAAGRPVRLKLAGDGSLARELAEKSVELGISSLVDFLGARRDIPELLAAADIFAFSVNAEEGLGIALVEAMAARVPVVATDVGACREVLEDGECGLLVPPQDPAALAEKITWLLSHPEEARELADKAYSRAQTVYHRKEMARKYAALCGAA
jgi:glycosyltransferase involved in cell wall biosynthesis